MLKSFFHIVLLFIINFSSAQNIDRMEPPFWWSDMQQTELQILCYGKDIGTLEVELSKGNLIQVRRTENPNYLFVLVDTKDMKPGYFQIEFIKKRETILTKTYELKKRRKNSKFRKGFDSTDVIYLLMPDRFANGNPNNDSQDDMTEKADRNFDGGRHGGDIQGIIAHIDYLNDLGVTTVWSTPLLEDNEPTYSYHTYAQSNYYRIDPRYGTNEDYKDLAKKLHQNNMKLIMDYVTNHWGSQHWMLQDLPTKDWVHIWENDKKGFQRSNYRMSTQFDPHASNFDKKACMDGWFDTSMPDMNLANPLVLRYMTQNAIWWIEYADLDGLRVDTYSYNDKEAIASWTKAIMNEYPNLNIVGEVWMHNQAQIAYWQKDSTIGNIEHYNSYLPSIMDFTLHDAIYTMFNEDKMNWNKGMIKAYDNFTNDFLYPNITNILIFAGNHDVTRINDYYQSDSAKYKLAMSLLLTTRGIPQLYYGDEIGMIGNKEKNGDGDIRKDFPGGWSDDKQNAFSEKTRTDFQKDYFNFTKKLLHWRKHKSVIHKGKLMQYVPQHNLYVYFRYSDSERVMVIINNSDKTQIIEWEDYYEGLNGALSGHDIISETKIFFDNTLPIKEKTSMIIELTNY